MPPPADRQYCLDGLRGWAAVSVALYHLTWELFGAVVPDVCVRWFSLLNDGPLAVYVFFVISGVALTHAFLRTGDRARLHRIALGRYARLVVPIAAASLIGLVLLRAGLLFNHAAGDAVGRPDWLGAFFSQPPSLPSFAFFSAVGAFVDEDPTRSYDPFLLTMPVELAGSFLLFGLLALAGGRAARLRGYAACLLFGMAVRPVLLPFIYGVMLAEIMVSPVFLRVSRGRAGNLFGGAAFAAAAMGSVLLRFQYGPRLCGVLALLVVGGVVCSPALRWLFQTAMSQWLGRISFSLFLTHGFVLCGFACWLIVRLDAQHWPPAAIAAAVVPSSMVLSLLAAQVFSPVDRAGTAVSRRFALLVAASLSAPSPAPDPLTWAAVRRRARG